MADNYLEKRMEEYRSGRLASKSRSTTSMRAPKRPDTLTLRYDPMTALIIADGITPVVAECIKAFAGVGYRIAFTAADSKEGNSLAQLTGARYYPSSFTPDAIVTDLTSRWGGAPDVAVTFTAASPAGPQRHVDATRWLEASAPATIIARHILYLSHPDNTFLSE